jgi:hypothetical protein
LAGKKAAITVVHRKGTGDKANQTYANVDFNGWESPDAITTTTTKAEPPQYADI